MRTIHVYHEQADRIAAALEERGLRAARLARLEDAEIVFASVPPRSGWAGARALRLVQLMGVGADDLLPSPDLPRSVQVACARGLFARETAEHAVALLLALVRGLPTLIERQKQRSFRPFAAGTLAGRTMVLLGLGEVGRRIARVALAMEMRVIGVRRTGRPIDPVREVLPPERLRDALASADVLVIAVPLTPQTRGLVDRSALLSLPERALIVNVGRGGVVDERALLDLLQEGRIAGAALDVFEEEPLPESSPFWTAPNTLVSPHAAGLGLRYLDRTIDLLIENVRRLESGEPLLGQVDRDAGY